MLADVAVRAAAAMMVGCCWLRARSSPAYGPAPALRSASNCEKEATAEREARDTRRGLAP